MKLVSTIFSVYLKMQFSLLLSFDAPLNRNGPYSTIVAKYPNPKNRVCLGTTGALRSCLTMYIGLEVILYYINVNSAVEQGTH